MRKTFAVWLIMGFVYLMCWTLMFSSSSFRWTFLYWEFFACLTCTTYVALIATGIAGIICRVNFGKGLAHYLHVEEALTKSGFAVGLFSNETEQPRPPKTSAATGITGTADEKHYGKGGQSDVGTGIQGSSAM
ncbi:hypothetical protein WOLCODRAFT_121305 [Wolfiporia cocos MD-104 SS10]|uniref:Uncharacterized protein n=1 Tax=Wolfiporia cocos (strain MD-104) TaxID=742152 RepID=A0A2H3K1R6_WOLCO|nr:hypothetical protein WOLCODRAFT_121305 [Wolfiporia cocos MD-104 SS10]